MVAGLVWVTGHVALISCALRLHLIQRLAGRLLFVLAVIAASVGAGGMALLFFMPDTLSVSDIRLLVGAPYAHLLALSLLSLSATRSGPRPSSHHT